MSDVMGDFTQDLHILPNADRINELLREDAKKIADVVKERLLAKVEEGRGSASCAKPVPAYVFELVEEDLKKWAGLYGYTCYVGKSTTEIHMRAKKVKQARCPTCMRPKATIWKLGMKGLAVATPIPTTVAALAFFGAPWPIIVVLGILMAMPSIAIAAFLFNN